MFRFLLLILAAMVAAVTTSCSDDLDNDFGPDGNIEDDGSVSVFHLCADHNQALDDAISAPLEFVLTDARNHVSCTFDGSLSFSPTVEVFGKAGAYTCRLKLGDGKIADGSYFVKVSINGHHLDAVNLVKFVDGVGRQEKYSQMSYSMLEGKGSKENPYLINDAADLLTFLYYLGEDEYQGYGLYFKQTASFDCPRRSEIIDGRSWTSAYFQGTYDGQGYEIRNMAYLGGGTGGADDNIGLFKGLYGAEVSGLNLTGAIITGGGSHVGILAGESGGFSKVSDVSINGTVIAEGDNVGGLIGLSTGTLTISNVGFSNLAVSGKNGVGGIVGNFKGDKLKVDNVATPNHIFSLSGTSWVGGICGYTEVSDRAIFTNITLEHSVDAESSDVKVIDATGDGAGGIVGRFKSEDGSYLENVVVKCPVSASKNVGGLIGDIEVDGRFSVQKILLASVVNAGENGGGFFGSAVIKDPSSDIVFSNNGGFLRYVIKQSAAAHVKGGDRLGGIAGYINGNNAKIILDPVEIAVNIKGTGYDIGGAFGHAERLTANVSRLNFSSTTMRVEGTGNVGGILGYASDCDISGNNSIDMSKHIPKADEIDYTYSGVVVASSGDAGGVAGYFKGTLRGLASKANVTSPGRAGGIVGLFRGEIRECAFDGNSSGEDLSAGIAAMGKDDASLYHCINYAGLTAGGFHQAGIVCFLEGSNKVNGGSAVYSTTNVHYCINRGNIVGGARVGGVVGSIFNYYSRGKEEVKYCANYGDIKAGGNADGSVGGVVGYFDCPYGSVSSCANHGSVSSSGVQKTIGGVCGYAGSYDNSNNHVMVERCMNAGTISCDNPSTKLGGVVGHLGGASYSDHSAIIRDCYNTGAILVDQKDDTGGILGYAASYTDTHRTFNRGEISHGNAIIGTHNSGSTFYHSHNYYLEGTGGSWPSSTSIKRDDMVNESKYGDFDFTNVWIMTGDGPQLRDCPFQL